MTNLLQNAVHSIRIGLEDYQNDEDHGRLISAVRNFYAGVLLLGKQCLLAQCQDEDPMSVLASQFVPKPTEDGSIVYEPRASRTVDFGELRERFRHFGLDWPEGSLKPLQEMRKDFEHYHAVEPKKNIQQAISNCFPIVAGFCEILGEDPVNLLGDSWNVMLEEHGFFSAQKGQCISSFSRLPWFSGITVWDDVGCPNCDSSLIYQMNEGNSSSQAMILLCRACGTGVETSVFLQSIIAAESFADDYLAMTQGGEFTLFDCPSCGEDTYLMNGLLNICLSCEFSLAGEVCEICQQPLAPDQLWHDDDSTCVNCGYTMDQARRDN